MAGSAKESVRIDRWLLAARMFKTRPLAQQACAGGKVSLNGRNADPHRAVRPGDRIEIQTPRGLRIIEVVGVGERRGTSADALALYEDHSPPPEPPTPMTARGRPEREAGAGRPSKRDRRQMDRLRRR